MRGRLIDFIFFICEYIQTGDMCLGMSMLTGLGCGHIDDLAWELVLGQNVVSLSKLPSLNRVTKRALLIVLEVFLRVFGNRC